MGKEFYLALMRQNGVPEGIISSVKKNTEEELKVLCAPYTKKKKGPKTDIFTAEDVISRLKEKKLAPGEDVGFELFLGKGGKQSAGRVTGHFVTYRLYAVVEYHNDKKGKQERKEIDAFKL